MDAVHQCVFTGFRRLAHGSVSPTASCRYQPGNQITAHRGLVERVRVNRLSLDFDPLGCTCVQEFHQLWIGAVTVAGTLGSPRRHQLSAVLRRPFWL